MNNITVNILSNAPILSCALHLPGSGDDFILLSRSHSNDFEEMPDGLYGVSISSTAQPPGTAVFVKVASTNNQVEQSSAILANGTIATMMDFFIAGGNVV